MFDSNQKVVWILGAGFSKALGGPLLKDLLRFYPEPMLQELHGDLLQNLPPDSAEHRNRSQRIHEMFRVRKAFNEAGEQRQWSDAEEFLDFLETAAEEWRNEVGSRRTEPSYVRPLLDAIRTNAGFDDVQSLATAARRAIAADCSLFLRNAQPDSERWAPYRDWARNLGRNHTIVTFNYDTIPDILAKQDGKLFVPLPNELSASKDKAAQEDKAPVFKVHGSVNWYRGNQVYRSEVGNHHDVDLTGNVSLHCNTPNDFAIGVPGPQKKNLISGCLSPLWIEAVSCISAADMILLVGYRFPPSDAMARQGILKAIRGNPRQDLRVFSVLGPASPDAARMEKLVQAAMPVNSYYPPKILPLFAEDFLSLAWTVDLLN